MVQIINLESHVVSDEQRVAELIARHDELVAAGERARNYRLGAQANGDLALQLHFAEAELLCQREAREVLDQANAIAASW